MKFSFSSEISKIRFKKIVQRFVKEIRMPIQSTRYDGSKNIKMVAKKNLEKPEQGFALQFCKKRTNLW